MPEKETIEKAREDARDGKGRSTQAGEFGACGSEARARVHRLEEASVASGASGGAETQQGLAFAIGDESRAKALAFSFALA